MSDTPPHVIAQPLCVQVAKSAADVEEHLEAALAWKGGPLDELVKLNAPDELVDKGDAALLEDCTEEQNDTWMADVPQDTQLVEQGRILPAARRMAGIACPK